MLTKKIKIENFDLYPDGKGGQLGDRGYINGAKILSISNDLTVTLDKEIDDSEKLDIKIDQQRRIEIARNHTGQHILSQSIINVCEVKTVSFHMGENYSTIDLQRKLSDKEIIESENLANEVVSKALEIKKYYVDRSQLNNLGLRKVSDVKDDRIRIVEIEGFDKNMCAGFHVDKTSQVMLIKILKQERVKGGLYRLYFVCGKTALQDYRDKNNAYNEIVSLLSSPEPVESLKTKLKELKQTQKNLNSLTKELMKLKAKEIYNDSDDFESVKIGSFKIDTDQGGLRFLAQNVLNLGKGIFILYNNDYFVIGSNVVDLKKIDFNIKGGGTNNIFMGKFNDKEGNDGWILKTLENLKSYI